MTASSPRKFRWQPVRSGLVNLFKYENQTFHYENGHLLLRGDNGSGKSRVLALQLPFLLDGEISPYRVEPDRDPAKRMEWNLLMDKHERRVGYTWIEFGRRDEDSEDEHFITLGCGMDARKGSGAPDRWYFITAGRVGIDFELTEGTRVLGERELGAIFENLEQSGAMYRKAGEYRTAVDNAMFKLGSRYRPLLDLLIQLRQPQLMRDMKEETLSDALSEALPPVTESLVAEVAESFQGLESDREQTEDHREMLESVEHFHDGYRQYLAVAIRRLCDVVRVRHSQFESATKELRKIEAELEETEATRLLAAGEAGEKATQLNSLQAEIEALRASPKMREKENLDAMLKRAEEWEADAKRSREVLEKAVRRLEEAERDRERRETDCTTLRGELTGDHSRLREKFEHLGEKDPASFFDWETSGLDAERAKIDELFDRRDRNIAHLRRLNREIDSFRQALDQARNALDRARLARDEAAERVREKEDRLSREIVSFGEKVRVWEKDLEVLDAAVFTRGEDWESLLGEWIEGREGTFSFSIDVSKARERVEKKIAFQEARVGWRRDELLSIREKIGEELEALREGTQPEPPAPHTRDAEARQRRDGAPFWRWLEFRDEIPVAEHAGWEAALEGSGLLDAWVSPDTGEVTLRNDDFLAAADESELDEEDSLAAVLDASHQASTILPFLRRIGNHRGAARCWVDREGRWANGIHHGHFAKDEAGFIGAAAREAARLRRMAELETELAELDAQLDGLADQLAHLERDRAKLGEEAGRAPSVEQAVEAAIKMEAEREHWRARESEFISAEETERAAVFRCEEAVSERNRDAADFGLAAVAEPEALEQFSAKLSQFRRAADAFWGHWQRFLDKNSELEQAREREIAARESHEHASRQADEKKQAADAARTSADTLLANVGASVEELLAKLQAAETRARAARAEREEAETRQRKAEIAMAQLGERKKAASEKREQSEGDRDRAVDRMEVFVEKRLFEDLDPAYQPDRTEFSATAAVELARRMEKELKDQAADDPHWSRLQSELAQNFHEFTDQLGRHGHVPVLQHIDELSVSVIRCEYQTSQRTVRELRDVLANELANRERVFEEREREIIENHLIGEAAFELQQRIRDGEQSVVKMNSEMARVTTSSGIQLRFGWNVADSADENLRSVRRIFLKTSAAWTLAERDEIGRFLQDRIRGEREADDTVSWREHLTRALDYRAWHRFVIERKSGGETTWKKLTKRTFGTGSGGEKALTLTVPQFAAAAAHYQSADRRAPRLILLDEVFVGIDAPTRSRLMGLLERFDLDYVMTSEREWGAFPTVSALAIYQLAARSGFNTVAVTRWIWNGREKIRAEEDEETTTVA